MWAAVLLMFCFFPYLMFNLIKMIIFLISSVTHQLWFRYVYFGGRWSRAEEIHVCCRVKVISVDYVNVSSKLAYITSTGNGISYLGKTIETLTIEDTVLRSRSWTQDRYLPLSVEYLRTNLLKINSPWWKIGSICLNIGNFALTRVIC